MATWHLSENGVARPTGEPELYQLASAGRWDCFACSELTQNQWVPLGVALQALARQPPPSIAPPPARRPEIAPQPAPPPPEPPRAPPTATYTIMALCIVAFLIEAIVDVVNGFGAQTLYGFNTATLQAVGADLGIRTTAGQPWRLVSAMFLHANLLHIISNMICFIGAGALAERCFGRARFLGMYLLGGLGGGVASILWNPLVTSVGASGAIFGVMGALVAFFILRREDFTPESLKAQQMSLLNCIVLNVLFGFTSPVINNAAHMGGLIFGFLAGLALTPPRAETDATRIRTAAATVGVALLVGGGFALDTWRVHRDPRVALITRLEAVAPYEAKISKSIAALEIAWARFSALASHKPGPKFADLAKASDALAKLAGAEAEKLRALPPPNEDGEALRAVALAHAEHLEKALRALADGEDNEDTVKAFQAEREAFEAGRQEYREAIEKIAR